MGTEVKEWQRRYDVIWGMQMVIFRGNSIIEYGDDCSKRMTVWRWEMANTISTVTFLCHNCNISFLTLLFNDLCVQCCYFCVCFVIFCLLSIILKFCLTIYWLLFIQVYRKKKGKVICCCEVFLHAAIMTVTFNWEYWNHIIRIIRIVGDTSWWNCFVAAILLFHEVFDYSINIAEHR